jgi:AcrR family transcriptional regulator
MAKKPARNRVRVPLNREKVLRCAVRMADQGGIEALSMRALAAKLGVEAMSLYNHVPGKDELLNGIVDLVVGEIEVPVGGPDWRASMRRRAHSVHEAQRRGPRARRRSEGAHVARACRGLEVADVGGAPVAELAVPAVAPAAHRSAVEHHAVVKRACANLGNGSPDDDRSDTGGCFVVADVARVSVAELAVPA